MNFKITFPEPPRVPAELPLYATVPPAWSLARVSEIAARLGVHGIPADAGNWFVVRNGTSTVEVFQASDSVRLERESFDAEGRRGGAKPPSKERAIAVAEKFHELLGSVAARAEVASVGELEVLVSKDRNDTPERRVVGLQVCHRYSLDGLPLIGPGAKAQVTVGCDGDIGYAYRFWREVKRTGTRNTVAPDKAFERFADSPLFKQLGKGAKVNVTSATLGLLCLPPTESQGVLVPAYVLRGETTTESLPNAPFVHYLAAADLDPIEAKKNRWSNSRPALLVG
jgi:hypothetical protein